MSERTRQLERHVQELARRHGVEVIYRGRGIGYRRKRRVTIPPIRGQVTYFTALHELGHVLGPNPRLRLSQEVAAWQWALANAIEEPTPATYRSILRALTSYSRRADRWQSMKRPPEFDGFTDEMRRRGER